MGNTGSDSSNTPKRDRSPVSVPSRSPSTDSRRTRSLRSTSTRSTKTPHRESTPRSSKSSTRSDSRHALAKVQARRSSRRVKDRMSNAGGRSQREKTKEGPCVLRVRNLNKSFDDSDVCNMFKPYGYVVSARVLYDLMGSSTGTADVVFMLRKSAIKVLFAINQGITFMGQRGLKAKITRG